LSLHILKPFGVLIILAPLLTQYSNIDNLKYAFSNENLETM
jgi:hypothetical protein